MSNFKGFSLRAKEQAQLVELKAEAQRLGVTKTSEELQAGGGCIVSGYSPLDVLKLIYEKRITNVISVNREIPTWAEEAHAEIKLCEDLYKNKAAYFANPFGKICEALKLNRVMLTEKVSSSGEKTPLINKMRTELPKVDRSGAITNAVLTIADELITNAIFDASETKVSRNLGWAYPRGKQAVISIGTSPDWLLIGCEDPYGTLLPRRMFSRIQDCYERGLSQSMREGQHGVGIGAYMMFDLCRTFFVVVDAGRKTFVGCLVPLGKRFKESKAQNKNVQILYSEEGRGKVMGMLSIERITGKGAQALTLKFKGEIDEDANFDPVESFAHLSAGATIHIDFNEVVGINSCGIREWIRWTRQMAQSLPGVSYRFTNCPPMIIDQINIVEGFLPPGATVDSFWVPYYCGHCEKITNILFSQGKEITPRGVTAPQSVSCPACKEAAEIDVIEESYFRFVQQMNKTAA